MVEKTTQTKGKLRDFNDPKTIWKKVVISDIGDLSYIESQGSFGERYVVDLNEHIDYGIQMNGIFDIGPSLCSIFLNKVTNQDGIYLDIGSNIGDSMLPQSMHGVDGVGVEASSWTANKLIKNRSLNDSKSSIIKTGCK